MYYTECPWNNELKLNLIICINLHPKVNDFLDTKLNIPQIHLPDRNTSFSRVTSIQEIFPIHIFHVVFKILKNKRFKFKFKRQTIL